MLEACGTHAFAVLLNLRKNVVFLNLHASAMGVKLMVTGMTAACLSDECYGARMKNTKSLIANLMCSVDVVKRMSQNIPKRCKAWMRNNHMKSLQKNMNSYSVRASCANTI